MSRCRSLGLAPASLPAGHANALRYEGLALRPVVTCEEPATSSEREQGCRCDGVASHPVLDNRVSLMLDNPPRGVEVALENKAEDIQKIHRLYLVNVVPSLNWRDGRTRECWKEAINLSAIDSIFGPRPLASCRQSF